MNMRIIWVVIGMICLSVSSDLQAAVPGQDPFAGCDARAVDADEAANIARIRANALAMRRQAEADQRLNNGHFLQYKPVRKKPLAADHESLVKKQDDIRAKRQTVEESLPLYAKELASQEAEAIVAAICPLSIKNQVALWHLLHNECPERALEMKIALFKRKSLSYDVYQAVLQEEFTDADKLVALVSEYPVRGLSPRTVARELLHAPVPVSDKALAGILAIDVFPDHYKRAIYEAVILRRPAFYKQVRTYLAGKENIRNLYDIAQSVCTAWVEEAHEYARKQSIGSSRGYTFKSISPEIGMMALQDLFDTHHAGGRKAVKSIGNVCAGLYLGGMGTVELRDKIVHFWLNQPLEKIDKNIGFWLSDESEYASAVDKEQCMTYVHEALAQTAGGIDTQAYRVCNNYLLRVRALRSVGGNKSVAASGDGSSGTSSMSTTDSVSSHGSHDLRELSAMARPLADGCSSSSSLINSCGASASDFSVRVRESNR